MEPQTFKCVLVDLCDHPQVSVVSKPVSLKRAVLVRLTRVEVPGPQSQCPGPILTTFAAKVAPERSHVWNDPTLRGLV